MAVHFQAAVGGSQRLGSHTNLAPLLPELTWQKVLLSRVYRGREANEIRILSTRIHATEGESYVLLTCSCYSTMSMGR